MDSLGRHNLKEMRKRVRRYTNLVMDAIGSPDNEMVSTLVGDEEINDILNGNLIKRWSEIVAVEPLHFTDTVEIPTVHERLEYPLPMDCMSVRILYLNDRDTWFELVFADGEDELTDANGHPTYKVRLNYLILKDDPGYSRLKLEYVKLPLALQHDSQVLETNLARPLQDIIVIDSAVELIVSRLGIDPAPLMAVQKEKEGRFRIAISMMVEPPHRQIRMERREWRND